MIDIIKNMGIWQTYLAVIYIEKEYYNTDRKLGKHYTGEMFPKDTNRKNKEKCGHKWQKICIF
jgi:hypothetical protein